jgi:hypothetical protein
LRHTSIATGVPGFLPAIITGTCEEVSTVWPSTLRITSPALMPPCSPGLSFSTMPTSAPRGRSRPNDSASCAVTSWIWTPMRLRVTRPVLTS